MTTLIFEQETDLRIPYQHDDNPIIFTESILDETGSGYLSSDYLPYIESNVLSSAWEFTQTLNQGTLKSQASDLLSSLQRRFSELLPSNLGSGYIPILQSYVVDDESILFEWSLPNFRLGFGLEADESQSSWYLVTSEELDNVNASGYMPKDAQKLLYWLTTFLTLYT